MVKKKTEVRREYAVTPEQFIEAWQTSNSADEVSQKLGMPKPIVHARASSYRQAGIKLKRMPRHSTRGLDVEGLNRLIEQLGGQSQQQNKKRAAINPDKVRAVAEDVVSGLHGKR